MNWETFRTWDITRRSVQKFLHCTAPRTISAFLADDLLHTHTRSHCAVLIYFFIETRSRRSNSANSMSNTHMVSLVLPVSIRLLHWLFFFLYRGFGRTRICFCFSVEFVYFDQIRQTNEWILWISLSQWDVNVGNGHSSNTWMHMNACSHLNTLNENYEITGFCYFFSFSLLVRI